MAKTSKTLKDLSASLDKNSQTIGKLSEDISKLLTAIVASKTSTDRARASHEALSKSIEDLTQEEKDALKERKEAKENLEDLLRKERSAKTEKTIKGLEEKLKASDSKFGSLAGKSLASGNIGGALGLALFAKLKGEKSVLSSMFERQEVKSKEEQERLEREKTQQELEKIKAGKRYEEAKEKVKNLGLSKIPTKVQKEDEAAAAPEKQIEKESSKISEENKFKLQTQSLTEFTAIATGISSINQILLNSKKDPIGVKIIDFSDLTTALSGIGGTADTKSNLTGSLLTQGIKLLGEVLTAEALAPIIAIVAPAVLGLIGAKLGLDRLDEAVAEQKAGLARLDRETEQLGADRRELKAKIAEVDRKQAELDANKNLSEDERKKRQEALNQQKNENQNQEKKLKEALNQQTNAAVDLGTKVSSAMGALSVFGEDTSSLIEGFANQDATRQELVANLAEQNIKSGDISTVSNETLQQWINQQKKTLAEEAKRREGLFGAFRGKMAADDITAMQRELQFNIQEAKRRGLITEEVTPKAGPPTPAEVIAPTTPTPTPTEAPITPPPTLTKRAKIFADELKSYGSDFMEKVNKLAKEFNFDPLDLLSIMGYESGLNPTKVNPNTGAAGLIQFMPFNLPGLGVTKEQLTSMSATDQLDLVRKFLKGTKLPNIAKQAAARGTTVDPASLYGSIFMPALADKPDDYIYAQKGSNEPLLPGSTTTKGQAYEANKSFDTEGGKPDGIIYKRELVAAIASQRGDVTSAVQSINSPNPGAPSTLGVTNPGLYNHDYPNITILNNAPTNNITTGGKSTGQDTRQPIQFPFNIDLNKYDRFNSSE